MYSNTTHVCDVVQSAVDAGIFCQISMNGKAPFSLLSQKSFKCRHWYWWLKKLAQNCMNRPVWGDGKGGMVSSPLLTASKSSANLVGKHLFSKLVILWFRHFVNHLIIIYISLITGQIILLLYLLYIKNKCPAAQWQIISCWLIDCNYNINNCFSDDNGDRITIRACSLGNI
jgi:hypothetical protein